MHSESVALVRRVHELFKRMRDEPELTRELLFPREGMEIENAGAAISTIRDGRIVRFHGFVDPAGALADFEAGAGD